MPNVRFPYGRGAIDYFVADDRVKGVLTSEIHDYQAACSQEHLVRDALEHPIGTPRLRAMAENKRRVLILASDHTRPVPSKIIMPLLLEEIRAGNPHADITILVATGCHRGTTRDELLSKFGEEIFYREKIAVHDCDAAELVSIGKLPSGGECVLNRLALDADLLVAEGFIEPHFFAGFSGGRKSVLPGVAGRRTVVYNHNAEFIAHPRSRTGILEGNLIHRDMLYAARAAHLAFICNVVINASKEIIYAVAGDCDLAHADGCAFLRGKCGVDSATADIAIASNGGYPLDQNIYQAVKGMTAAEATVRKGGAIIMLAESIDGHGGEEFYRTFAEEQDLDRMLSAFMEEPRESTRIDQWQSQIFARVLKHARVIYVSAAPDEMVSALHMTPAHSLEEAVQMAEALLGDPKASITAIPDGVSVMVR